MPKLKISLNIGYQKTIQQDVIKIDDIEWEECETDEDREKLMDEYYNAWVINYIDGEYEIIDDPAD